MVAETPPRLRGRGRLDEAASEANGLSQKPVTSEPGACGRCSIVAAFTKYGGT